MRCSIGCINIMFLDREDAANRLVDALKKYGDRKDAIILAIPRGGVVIGSILARKLNLKLDIILTKKIGHPGNPEYAIGVVNLVAEFIDEAAMREYGIPRFYIEEQVKRIRGLLQARYKAYRGDQAPVVLHSKIVIIVDDGVATGNTIMAAIQTARGEGAEKIVVAVPVGPPATLAQIRKVADEVICLDESEDFFAIGQFYAHFNPIEDGEAIQLLQESSLKSI